MNYSAVLLERAYSGGRFSLACLLADRDGVAPPLRREPCFFDPRHGPAAHDVPWTPLGGVARSIAVCGRDQGRLERGEEPATRLLRVGDRYLPWHEAGSSVAAVARHQAHVGRGVATSLTSGHVAEAHARSATGHQQQRRPPRLSRGARPPRSGAGAGRPRPPSRSSTGRP